MNVQQDYLIKLVCQIITMDEYDDMPFFTRFTVD